MSGLLRLVAGSLVIAVLAALSSWLVTSATTPYGVPAPASAVLASVAAAAVVGFGSLWLARRHDVSGIPQHAAAMTGPAALGLLMFPGSTAAWWFPVLVLGALLVAAQLGVRAGGRQPLPLRRSEVGSGSMELVGVVTLAAVLVAAVTGTVAAYDPHIRDTIWAQICKITGGSCPASAAPSEVAHKPENCSTYESETSVRGVVDIAFVRLGGGGAVQRTEFSDGTTEITLLGEGRAGLVASAGGRTEFKFGDTSLKAALEAEAAITGGYTSGDTYTFTDSGQADEFESYLKRELGEDISSGLNPVYGLVNRGVEWVTGEEPPTNAGVQKTYVRYDVTEEASASASAGYGSGLEGSASYMVALGSEYDRGADPDSNQDDIQSDFYQVDWSVAGQANLPAVFTVSGSHQASGIVKVVRDVEGTPVRVEIVDRTTGSFEVGSSITDSSLSPIQEPGKHAKPSTLESLGISFDGGSENSVVVNQSLDLDTPESLAAFDSWFNWSNGLDSALYSTAPGVDSTQGENIARGEAFSELMASQGKVSVIEYDGETFGLGAAIELGLGLKLGFDVGGEERSSQAVQATYLGGPAEDGIRPVYDLPECY